MSESFLEAEDERTDQNWRERFWAVANMEVCTPFQGIVLMFALWVFLGVVCGGAYCYLAIYYPEPEQAARQPVPVCHASCGKCGKNQGAPNSPPRETGAARGLAPGR